MRNRVLSAALAALCVLPLSAPSANAQSPTPGWSSDTVYNPGGTVRRLSTGELIVFDGQVLTRQSADGSVQTVLHDFLASDFTGAFAIDPTETFALLGRGNGDVFTADLVAGGVTFYTTFAFGGYDAEFSPAGWCAVSAPSGAGDNAIYRCEFGPDSVDLFFLVPGPSGPLSFDAPGNLYYAPASTTFPTPVGSINVLLILGSDIDALAPGQTMSPSDAIQIASGFDGASRMVVDRDTGRIYIAENNFATGTNRVRLVVSTPSQSPTLYEGPLGQTIGLQDFVSGSGGATFERFQPSFGGSLAMTNTDFSTVSDRREIRPRRADVALTGPGTVGFGPFDLEVSNALPGGQQILLYGPAATTGPEIAIAPFLPPLFVGLDLVTLRALPFGFVADGAGNVDFPLFNPTGAVGAVAIQMLLVDESGDALATTAPVIL